MTLYDKIHSIKNVDTPVIISDNLQKDKQSFMVETVSGEVEKKYKKLINKNIVSEDNDGDKKIFIVE